MSEQEDHNGEQPLGAFLRQQRVLSELTLNQFAGMVGISNAYLSQIERGLRRPSENVLDSIARGLHLSADALEQHIPKPADPADSGILAAIDSDPRLTARQRTALGETYRAFVAANSGRAKGRGD